MESGTASQAEARSGFEGGPASAYAGTIDVRRPVDGSTIRSVPIDPPERVAEVVARVRALQPAWEALGIAGRRRWLERLRDWMLDNEARLADVMQEETGKVRAEADLGAPILCGTIKHYTEYAYAHPGEEEPHTHILPLKVKRLRSVY